MKVSSEEYGRDITADSLIGFAEKILLKGAEK